VFLGQQPMQGPMISVSVVGHTIVRLSAKDA
jgi:hypothetical protein